MTRQRQVQSDIVHLGANIHFSAEIQETTAQFEEFKSYQDITARQTQ